MKKNLNWLIPACVALALGSCTTKNEYSSLEISKLVPPTTPEALDAAGALSECTYNTNTAEYSVQAFNVSRDFVMGLVVTNNLANNANTLVGRLNTNDFIATQVVTTYEATDGSVLNVGEQITPTQGTIPAGAGIGTVVATLIPAAVASAMQQAGVTSVRLHTHVEGRLLDGSSISSNEYLPVAIPTTSDTDSSSCVGTN